MKVNCKKIISTLLILIILFITMQTKTFASVASASISAGSTTINVGDTTTISVSVNSAESYALELSSSGGVLSGTTKIADAPGSEISKNVLSASFKADSAGKYTITLTGQVASTSQVDEDKKTNVSTSITITVNAKEEPKAEEKTDDKKEESTDNEQNSNDDEQEKSDPKKETVPAEVTKTEETEKPKSSNNSLKSLTVSDGKLNPSFDRAITDYEVEFDNDSDIKSLTSITINAQKEDSKAKITGTGKYDISEGENYFKVEVTAENGSKKTYTIKINKPEKIEQSDLRIKTLEVNKIDNDNNFIKATLDKDFDPENFEYVLNVEKNIKALDVDAKVEKDGINIKIDGTDNLKDGENNVTITLTSADDESIKTVYTIKVIKEKSTENENVIASDENTDKQFGMINYKALIIGFIALIIVLVIVLIVLILINKRSKNKNIQDEDIDEDELDDSAKEFWSKKVNDTSIADISNTINSIEEKESNDEKYEENGREYDSKNEQINNEETTNNDEKIENQEINVQEDNKNDEYIQNTNEELEDDKHIKKNKHKGKHF